MHPLLLLLKEILFTKGTGQMVQQCDLKPGNGLLHLVLEVVVKVSGESTCTADSDLCFEYLLLIPFLALPI